MNSKFESYIQIQNTPYVKVEHSKSKSTQQFRVSRSSWTCFIANNVCNIITRLVVYGLPMYSWLTLAILYIVSNTTCSLLVNVQTGQDLKWYLFYNCSLRNLTSFIYCLSLDNSTIVSISNLHFKLQIWFKASWETRESFF